MELPQRETQRWALGLEYRGTAFCGWQRQVGQPSVQQALEEALSSIATEPVTVIAAGRTDTAVHASMQVVHFETEVEPVVMDRLPATTGFCRVARSGAALLPTR